MAITEINLVGGWENFDLTIANLLETNWTKANTLNLEPSVNSATGHNVQTSWPGITGYGTFQIHCNVDDDIMDPNRSALGDNFHTVLTTVRIDVFARDDTLLKLAQREINRILWENRPNSGTRINKSDGSASPIAQFENSEVDFIKEQLISPDLTSDMTHSAATLQCLWHKSKS